MNEITRPALRYFGGKWRLAPWILSWFPPHTTYVEPFCGAASVFLRKQPAEIAVINDIDGEIVNFFRVLRERTEDLIKAIKLTPYSREEYDLAWTSTNENDPLEKARRYYVRIWQGWGGSKGTTKYTWRIQYNNNRGKFIIDDWTNTDALWPIAERLTAAFIENDDALKVIERFDTPDTLFYCDPPYLKDRRRNSYTHEMTREQHIELLNLLNHIQGMVIISGYPSDLYDQKLATWYKTQTTARTTNTSNTVTETLWISPSAMEARQRTLFEVKDAGRKTKLLQNTPALKPASTLA